MLKNCSRSTRKKQKTPHERILKEGREGKQQAKDEKIKTIN